MPSAGINPFTSNPPSLPSPTKSRFHNRSLSRSPVRPHPRDLDPLLRDLSPTSTLRAFITPASTSRSTDVLAASVHTSSASEKALGAKAAQACLDLRSWTHELEGWQWPGTFDFPEHAREQSRKSVPPSNRQAANGEEEQFWGCLPARTVQAYERRADEIGQLLDDMDIEELKDFVLNSHYRADSRPSSRDERMSTSSTSSTSMKPLDSYTALVTATILQALPFLTRLSRLLDIWTIRLIVLSNAPQYVQDLQRAKDSVDKGWTAIAVSSNSGSVSRFDRKIMMETKSSIEQQMGSLGRRLDRFLDDLEGRDDSVPDSWIDEFELLESGYGSWVVQAERRVLENEWWNHLQSQVEQETQSGASRTSVGPVQSHGDISEIEDPALDDDAVVRMSTDSDHDKIAQQPAATNNVPQLVVSIPSAVETKPEASSSQSAKPISRTETPVSAQEDTARQLAGRRAAFLHDIEINNSLKQSKSPVRPFEHASSAFTRLFKKNQSPEQVKSKLKRSTSNSIDNPITERSTSSTGASRQVSTHNASGLSRGPIGMSPDADATGIGLPIPQLEARDGVSNSTETPSHYGPSSAPVPVSIAEKLPLETYKPTGLDSPFSSPDKEDFAAADKAEFLENWPLNQAPTTGVEDYKADERLNRQQSDGTFDDSDSGPEIYKPSRPIQTDAFDELFVQSMPMISAEEQHEAIRYSEGTSSWNDHMLRQSSASHHGEKAHPDMAPSRSRPTSASRVSSNVGTRDPSTSSQESLRDAPTGTASNMASSPELSSSSRAQFLIKSSLHRSSSSPPASPESFHESNAEDASIAADDVFLARPSPIKRASMTSIGIYSRSQVKSVDVQRPSRHSSNATPPHTPKLPTEPESSSKTHSMDHKTIDAFPTPPMRHTSFSGQIASPLGRATPIVARGIDESSPLAEKASGSPSNTLDMAPLNVAMTKRRAKNPLQKENERPASPISAEIPSPQTVQYPDVRDTFDRHVSDVLETLPAPIRFKPRAGAETPIPRAGEQRGYNAPRTKMSNMRVPSKSSSMTIAPAESSPKKSSSAADPVKLYHLTQPGRDEPIKLFVRLVGEGERVMVRVGGGWADLYEYLNQYATHHGSRTVSEGTLEVQSITAPVTRKVSGPAEMRAKTPGPGTPNNGTLQRPNSNDSDKDWSGRANTPYGDRSYASNGRQTPTSMNGEISTPKSTSTGSSRPSTANVSRPSSRQGGAGDVGLAGSSSKKLPEHKAKWVEGMLERAKKASAEKSKDDNQKYFSELGKAGGTRRVIFRSSPGFSTGDKSKS